MMNEIQGCKLQCAAGFKCLRLSALLCFSGAVGKAQAEKVGAFSLEKRRLHGDLIANFQPLKGAYKEAGEGLFIGNMGTNYIRSNGYKWKEGKFSFWYYEEMLLLEGCEMLEHVAREAVDASALAVFKTLSDPV